MSTDQENLIVSQGGNKKTKEKRTKLLDLFRMCLDRREMESKMREQNLRNLLTVEGLRDNSEFKEIQRFGLEKFVDEVIKRGVALSTNARVFVGAALTSSETMREELRTKESQLFSTFKNEYSFRYLNHYALKYSTFCNVLY